MQRFLLYQMRNVIVQPFGETAQQVFARVSAQREAWTGTGVSLLDCQPFASGHHLVMPLILTAWEALTVDGQICTDKVGRFMLKAWACCAAS